MRGFFWGVHLRVIAFWSLSWSLLGLGNYTVEFRDLSMGDLGYGVVGFVALGT